MKKLYVILSLIVLGIVAVVLVSAGNRGGVNQLAEQESEPGELKVGIRVGNIAPDFEVETSDGQAVRLSDFSGTPVFLNFWATWCPFCVDELPLMARMQEEFGDSYATLVVNRAESVSRAESFLDQINLTGEEMNFVYDKDDSTYSRFGGFSMPYSIFIDSDGVIKSLKHGPLTETDLRQRIEQIL